MSPRVCSLLLLAAALAFSACERPFVEVARPSFRILAPDTTEAIASERVLLRVEPTSFRGVDTVRAAGQRLLPVGGGAAFEGTVTLRTGINLIPLEAVDAGGIVGRDTVRLLSLRSGTTAGPVLPEARADHAAIQLASGALLVTGGVAARGAAASDAAFLLRPNQTQFQRLPARLVVGRSGHTMTLLPTGQVLIVGGTRREGSRATADLVETVELFDPASETFTLLPVQGAPVRHVQHAAFLAQQGAEQRLYLVGGEGDVDYLSPRYAVRGDFRRFTVLSDRLVAISPVDPYGQGARLEPLEGHTALPLAATVGSAMAPLQVFVAGVRPGTSSSARLDPVAFELRLTAESVREVPAAAPVIPRTHHAGTTLGLDYGFLLGGMTGAGETTGRAELYSAAARRYFLVPTADLLEPRLDASATSVGNGRIRVVGGFSPFGVVLATTLLYSTNL